jgi:glycosyltransferase involved in cell wall biosynthesis
MRIALYHNLTSGGSKREAYEFARQLTKHDHVVHLYCPSTANEEFLPLAAHVAESFTFPLNLIPPFAGRLPLLRRYVDLAAFLVNVRRLQSVALCIARAIDERRYDWVFTHHDLIVQSPYLFRYLRTPSAYYCAEPMREFYEPPVARPYKAPSASTERLQKSWYAPARRAQQMIIKREDRRNVRCASVLLTNSFFSAESIYRAYGLRARVSYLGVDAEQFRPCNLERKPFVLSVGAVAPLKGYEFLIEALAQVAQSMRPAFIVVGNTASSAETRFLKRLAAARGVCVEFRVNVSDAELVTLYNEAQALVYAPILEPFGFAPLEAMACGTPVVAVKEGGVRESVRDGETGFLTARDTRCFAEALQKVMSDVSLARALGVRGREWVLQQWTWDAAYERLMRHLNGNPR